MSALVRFQGKVICFPAAYGEVLPLIDGTDDVADREESSPEMGNEESLLMTGDMGEYCSHVDEMAACSGDGGSTVKRADDADLFLYRDRTVMLLKQYARMAVESGRLPSPLGRECFGTRVTSYAMASFEDMAIFVHDMGAALRRLSDVQQQLIMLNVLEEFSQWEIAKLLGCTTRWIEWQISDALDDLTRGLVKSGLVREECQERRKNESAVSG
jgi:hypothetical protein